MRIVYPHQPSAAFSLAHGRAMSTMAGLRWQWAGVKHVRLVQSKDINGNLIDRWSAHDVQTHKRMGYWACNRKQALENCRISGWMVRPEDSKQMDELSEWMTWNTRWLSQVGAEVGWSRLVTIGNQWSAWCEEIGQWFPMPIEYALQVLCLEAEAVGQN